MKILLSCVNSVVAFIGLDLSTKKSFWYCPADRVRACGAAYDYKSKALLVASDNILYRLHASGKDERINLPGPHVNLAHSVHMLDESSIAVTDTGNSRVLIYGHDLKGFLTYEPLESWGAIPEDAIHLNDFVQTPFGLVASCFNFQSFRSLEEPGHAWQKRGYGLLLTLEKFGKRNVSRVVGMGLACPHSLVWHNDRLYCCSSATGEFLRLRRTEQGIFVEEERKLITTEHFLRGALPLEDGRWILGGSSLRKADRAGMGVFILSPDGSIETIPVAPAGEIYDILPWEQSIMKPVSELMLKLPPEFAEEGNEYPAPCKLPE